MPWTLDPLSLLTVFLVVLVAALGWTLGAWLMSRLLAALSRG